MSSTDESRPSSCSALLLAEAPGGVATVVLSILIEPSTRLGPNAEGGNPPGSSGL